MRDFKLNIYLSFTSDRSILGSSSQQFTLKTFVQTINLKSCAIVLYFGAVSEHFTHKVFPTCFPPTAPQPLYGDSQKLGWI